MGDLNTNFLELWTRNQAEVRRYVFMLLPRPTDVDDVIQETAVALLIKRSNSICFEHILVLLR